MDLRLRLSRARSEELLGPGGRRPSMLSWSARSSSDFGYEPAILEGCGERNRDRWGGYFATDLEGHLHTTVELNML